MVLADTYRLSAKYFAGRLGGVDGLESDGAPRRSVSAGIGPSPVAGLAGLVVSQPVGSNFLRAGYGTISSPYW